MSHEIRNDKGRIATSGDGEPFMGAWLYDYSGDSEELFCMIAAGWGGEKTEAYVGRYPNRGGPQPSGNQLPHALTETGLQIPVGEKGATFLTYEELDVIARHLDLKAYAQALLVRESQPAVTVIDYLKKPM